MTPMNAEITALVATWRKQADTHENYRHHLSDPYGDIGHVHEVKAKRLRMCADELERLAASRPAPAPSMPEPSPARAGYPYTEAGDRVMAERFPAPPVGEAERLLRDGDASRLRNIADAMAGRVDWEFWQDAMVDMRAIAHAIDQVAALASPAPQPADGVTQAQHEIVASIIDMVEHDQSRRAEMNRLRADALRAVLARALASPAPPATNEHEQAAQQILVTLAPLVSDAAIVGRTYGWPEVLAVVNAAAKKLASPAPQPAAPAPVEPPDWMSERQADWQHGAPVEPPPALVDCDYQGYEFGAGFYPDSVCIEGRLHDADNCDDDGAIYLNDEDIPCPICRRADAIAYWTERNHCGGATKAEARRSARRLVADIRKNRGLTR